MDAVGEAPGGAEDHASLMCGESTESFRRTPTPFEIAFAQWCTQEPFKHSPASVGQGKVTGVEDPVIGCT